MVFVRNVTFSAKTQLWCVVVVIIMMAVIEVAALNGPNVCMVKQKYNITKRVKYRAPMSVRTYEWCMSIPPRCSRWSTEMRDLTRLETEERTAEVAVCCPGYKMRDVSCVPLCPNGRTGPGCSQECPPNKWGPNCVHECGPCSEHGICSPVTGECACHDGWQGESCESRMSPTTSTTTARVEELLTKQPATKPTPPSSAIPSTTALETTTAPTSKITTIRTTTTEKTSQLTAETTTTTTINIQETTATPLNAVVETIPSTKKEGKVENVQRTTKTVMTETTTVKAKPLTTSSSILTTGHIASKKTTAMEHVPQTTKAIESTVNKANINENINKPVFRNTITTTTSTEKPIIKLTTAATTESYHTTTMFTNMTLSPFTSTEVHKPIITQTTRAPNFNTFYTKPEHTNVTHPREVHVEIKTTPIRILKASEVTNTAVLQKTTAISVFTNPPIVTTHATTITEGTTKLETTRRPDATIRYFPTTVKFKPKEIWIRPAQKGESFESKKTIESYRHRVATNKEPLNTTPKTIIVSIIPTSVSYATFKKIALTTASGVPLKNITVKTNATWQGTTKPMSVLTTLSPLFSNISTSPTSSVAPTTNNNSQSSTIKTPSKPNDRFHHVAKTVSTLSNAKTAWRNKTVSSNGTNSMATVTQNLNSSITPTVSMTNFITTHKASVAIAKITKATQHIERVTKPVAKVTTKPILSTKTVTVAITDKEKANATKTKDISRTNIVTTESPDDDEETFHILTEPEHITAVMEGKDKQRTSVDLISVISIAGGIMMAVITVAVIIVMVERCRRPRYEDVRKMNDIHMQVMIDNNDVPPPYVRSIFHTPLPDPPSSDKCHYQPISTLDRNLKQFMRPVVVQTISPMMLENFRGILECHYDHLPRRSHDFEVRPKHCIRTPSSDNVDELSRLRPCSIAESTIDALKCEAQLDVLDSTTAEPLYAEIPCWRPPSEHAIEVMNYNGEAVTEL